MAPGPFALWLDNSAIWQIGLILLTLMILAAAVGHLLYHRDMRPTHAAGVNKEVSKTNEDYILQAVLGLLALLMGFTFALAVDRFEARRGLVLEEANAISTAYLNTQLLPEPHRARISSTLVAYTDHRVAIGTAPRKEARSMLPADDRLITELWTEMVAAFPSIKNLDFSSTYLDSMSRVVEVNAARKIARLTRVPPTAFFILFIYLIVTAGVLGYVLVGLHGRMSATFLLVLFWLSMLLILDIDQPTSGSINETQAAMQELKIRLAKEPPEIFDHLTSVP